MGLCLKLSERSHRHQQIAQRQGNRNPFVDIPGLLDVIGPETFVQIENAR